MAANHLAIDRRVAAQPIHIGGCAQDIRAGAAIEIEHARIGLEPAVPHTIFGNIRVFQERQCERNLALKVCLTQTLKIISDCRAAAPAVHNIRKQIIGQPVSVGIFVTVQIRLVRR